MITRTDEPDAKYEMYRDATAFIILDIEVLLYSEEVNGNLNTVAQIDNDIYYLGDNPPNILSAVEAFEEFTNAKLSQSELNKVMIDNNLISKAV
jgi:hypothetical protein